MAEPTTSNSAAAGVSYLYMAAAFVVVVAGMRAAEGILNPLLLAVFLSVISAPAYFGLLKKGVANWLALLIVIGVLSIVVLGVAYVVMDSIGRFSSQQDHYRGLIEDRTRGIQKQLEAWVPDWLKDAPPAEEVPVNPAESEVVTDQVVPDEGDVASQEPTAEEGVRREETSEASLIANSTEEPVENLNTTEASEAATEIEADLADAQTEIAAAEAAVEELAAGKLVTVSPQVDADIAAHKAGDTLFAKPTSPLPNNEQSWREYWSEQFSLRTALTMASVVVERLGQLLGNTFLVLLTVIFILLEAGTFTTKLKDAFVRTDDMTQRAQQIVESIQHYIVIKTWVSLATGVLVVVWLKFLGVSYAPLWGLLAFLFNFIPNVGSFIAAIPAVLIAWLELTTLPAVACAIGFIVVNGAIGNFIEPRLMGRGLGLSPLVVFCSMVFWGWVLGPIGMLLSVPLTMTARIAMDGFDDTKWIATLMGNADSAA